MKRITLTVCKALMIFTVLCILFSASGEALGESNPYAASYKTYDTTYWPARTSKKPPRRTASKRKSSTQITLNAAEEMLLFACWNCDFDG